MQAVIPKYSKLIDVGRKWLTFYNKYVIKEVFQSIINL